MIAVFDSGVGGLTVAKSLKIQYPALPLLYVGDTARYPWGNKSPAVIRKYCDQFVNYFQKKNINRIIIACNTASTFAGSYLRDHYRQVTFFDVIDPVMKTLTKQFQQRKISKVGIIGTRGTIASHVYQSKIKQLSSAIKIQSRACPLLVPLVEENFHDHPATSLILKHYLQHFTNIDHLILGCTHYPLLQAQIQELLGPKVKLLSSAREIAKQIKLNPNDFSPNRPDEYFFTDCSSHYHELTSRIMDQSIKVKQLPLSQINQC
ncbi:MAG: glutamate racemase [Candidatus Moranbacteria bacterium]|nr:glutamate racemase [Candidatus Moranbacteria bacterium]